MGGTSKKCRCVVFWATSAPRPPQRALLPCPSSPAPSSFTTFSSSLSKAMLSRSLFSRSAPASRAVRLVRVFVPPLPRVFVDGQLERKIGLTVCPLRTLALSSSVPSSPPSPYSRHPANPSLPSLSVNNSPLSPGACRRLPTPARPPKRCLRTPTRPCVPFSLTKALWACRIGRKVERLRYLRVQGRKGFGRVCGRADERVAQVGGTNETIATRTDQLLLLGPCSSSSTSTPSRTFCSHRGIAPVGESSTRLVADRLARFGPALSGSTRTDATLLPRPSRSPRTSSSTCTPR